MKINPITNNTTFGSKIKYNQALQKGFELTKDAAVPPSQKNIDFAKTFSDSIRTILQDGKQDSVEITKKSQTYSEGYSCAEEINSIASKLNTQKEQSIETLRSQLEGAKELVEVLKEKYATAVKQELEKLEKQIKNSN